MARLSSSVLSTAYKVESRKTSKMDVVQNITRDLNDLSALLTHFENRLSLVDQRLSKTEKGFLSQNIEKARNQVDLADQSRGRTSDSVDLSDEPIAKILYPESSDTRDSAVWHDYRAWLDESSGLLHVEGKLLTIDTVTWLSDSLLELSFANQSTMIHATPLQNVEEVFRDDEAQKGDTAVLVGQYVIIAEGGADHSHAELGCTMANYLKVINVEENGRGRRGVNRRQEDESLFVCSFR